MPKCLGLFVCLSVFSDWKADVSHNDKKKKKRQNRKIPLYGVKTKSWGKQILFYYAIELSVFTPLVTFLAVSRTS